MWKETLYSNMEIFDNDERREFYDILMSNYNNLLEKKDVDTAHKLKSNCLQLGITPIASIAECIESNGKFDNYKQELSHLINQIKTENLFNL